ncbi:hypothetical protein BUALT_Bualt03G0092400 [Buddleja alternifolia]|uniref:Uncharacterized protein n=1 Tax=Buddleja alternifolia TaxID=168488 RepID=A0AAV6XTV9_9LAMI|nr:hypothetical protein BUALT_Bualt03G0092400 [Buddleja alternifolia]
MFGFTMRGRLNGSGSHNRANSMGEIESARQNGAGSHSRTNSLGEIDTATPFQSVKAAVSLFGDASPAKPNPVAKKSNAEERVLEKETQHHMMLRELDYYKDQLKNAETAKAQALKELQRANRTLQQLTNKLETLSESKQASIKATEAAKIRAKELEEQKSLRAQLGTEAWRLDVDTEREHYKACTGELNSNKQELANLRQDFDAAIEAKLAIFQEAEDAQHTAKMNQDRQSQLEKEVADLQETLDHVNLAKTQAQEEHSKLMAEKEALLITRKLATEEALKEIVRLKEEYEPKEILDEKLEQTSEAIKILQEQLKDVHAKKALKELVAEESSLRSCVVSVKLELEEVKRDRSESHQRALDAESAVEKLQAELEKKKAELDEAMLEGAYGMRLKIENLSAEAETGRQEAEDIKKNAELLKQEAEAATIAAKEAEEKLKIALEEAEAAKAAHKLADDQIHNYPRTDSGSIRKIRLSDEEFDLMNMKIEEFRNQADVKVATALAQLEAINASEKGVLQKLEVTLKENEAMQSEIEDVLKRAEMAEAAKKAVERELQKWRQKEQSKVEEPSHISEKK